MANKQTKAYRKLGISTKVTKGTGGFTIVEAPIFKGQICNTAFKNKSKFNKRKSAWRGGAPRSVSHNSKALFELTPATT